MSYQLIVNPKTGKNEILISGWENGIADSPYRGITKMFNMSSTYYPGALYPNYLRTSALNSGTTSQLIFGTSTNPNGATIPSYLVKNYNTTVSYQTIYFMIDVGDGTSNFNARVYQATDGGKFDNWSNLGLGGTNLQGYPTGFVYYAPQTTINTLPASATVGYLFAWAAGVSGSSDGFSTLYYAAWNGSAWGNWTKFGSTGEFSMNNYAKWVTTNKTMYFCNGNLVGSFGVVGNTAFNPGGTLNTDYTFSLNSLILPGYESAIWLEELNGYLLIAAGNRIYVWNFLTPNPQTFIQFPEPINKIIVYNNNIYALCGLKGNIYISNGYNVSLFKKIPDSFFLDSNNNAQIDPEYLWGGIMVHRDKLFFGVTMVPTSSQGGSNQSGIFSIDVNTRAINFETQNSYGLTSGSYVPINNSGMPSVLIEDNTSSTDFYYAGWGTADPTGSAHTGGGIDMPTVSSTPTSTANNYYIVETDLVPVGSFLNPSTPSTVEFRLDYPLTSGDTITMYGRNSLSSAYAQFDSVFTSSGTETTWSFNSAIQNLQWIQLKVVINTISGKFFRLRDLRIRANEPLMIASSLS